MSELLDVRGEKSFGFKKIGDNELYLFPCGVKRSRSDGYFESRRFNQFLSNVRNSFDYVIFDSAPIGGFADTQTLCSKVDGVIMVITYDQNPPSGCAACQKRARRRRRQHPRRGHKPAQVLHPRLDIQEAIAPGDDI
jgi:cellulose biosynthesis protein BcsQ